MKFPFIPISFLIADVRSELKRMDIAGEINEEDCINTAVECIREIGGANIEPADPVLIDIVHGSGKLPGDFYVMDEMWLCNEGNSNSQLSDNSIWFTKENRSYRRTSRLFPGDSMTGALFNGGPLADSNNLPTYIIRKGMIRTSIIYGTFALTYFKLPTAENGEMQMQDEIYSIKATKAYIKKMLLSERYYEGRLSENIWSSINRDYESNVDQAQAIFKFPDAADAKALGYLQDHRYDAFNLR